MQFYLAALDDLVRLPDENPSIGIILCKTKDRVVVEYALRYADKPIGVAEYQIVKETAKSPERCNCPHPSRLKNC